MNNIYNPQEFIYTKMTLQKLCDRLSQATFIFI